ncbi:MAG: ribonuclease H-like domain-containing protein [Alphaproteobacteria bacterium]|uniref:Ribonuclease H-like domain-containing protein n=1 Tax=Candidatus Nitrobium versatile TaxID=2884831 RepID=A0A953M258_9BACT|nr:ribonuclease H-like domain-containing protein [Candidatus Nitrobium versatile]
MSRVIFDIETVGMDFDSLDPSVREYLLKWAATEEEETKVRESLSFYPLTGQVVAIGMLNPDTNKGAVYFQTPGDPLLPFEEDGIKYESGTEKEILEKFWSAVRTYNCFVTFNGRVFDCPFLIVRSAVNRVKPTRDLMPNRYNGAHIDLLDQLTFFGAAKRRFSLDMWCRTFDIKSPKADGITGYEVRDLFHAGRHIEIARYCAGDLRATRELLLIWETYMRFNGA